MDVPVPSQPPLTRLTSNGTPPPPPVQSTIKPPVPPSQPSPLPPAQPVPPDPKPKSNLTVLWVALIMFIIGVICGILLTVTYPNFMNKTKTVTPASVIPSPTIMTPVATVSPTPESSGSAGLKEQLMKANPEMTITPSDQPVTTPEATPKLTISPSQN